MKIFYVPSFDEWLASDEAEDLNEDGELDEADYELFVELYFDEDYLCSVFRRMAG